MFTQLTRIVTTVDATGKVVRGDDEVLVRPLTDKVLVLDLDSTLVCTQESLNSLQRLQLLSDPAWLPYRHRVYVLEFLVPDQRGGVVPQRMWGIIRPGVTEFLRFAWYYFREVLVWSAGQKYYVEAIVQQLFQDIHYPTVTYSFDETVFDELNQVNKPLLKLQTEDCLTDLLDLRNTLILDDNPTVTRLNPANGVLIPAYNPSPTHQDFLAPDTRLAEFQAWLMQPEVMAAPDVRELAKEHIFN